MIVVLVKVETTVDAIDTIRDALVEMEKASQAEAGCHDYTFSQEIGDPSRVRIVEIWESMDALEFHFSTPHMATFRAVMAGSPPRSMDVKVHELGAQLEMPS